MVEDTSKLVLENKPCIKLGNIAQFFAFFPIKCELYTVAKKQSGRKLNLLQIICCCFSNIKMASQEFGKDEVEFVCVCHYTVTKVETCALFTTVLCAVITHTHCLFCCTVTKHI